MTEPERPIKTFHAFCSLLLPGLGQLLQNRVEAAIGFFLLFIISGFLPVLIVSLLFMDRFSQAPLSAHIFHIALFGGLFWLFVGAIVWAAVDAVRNREGCPPRLVKLLAYIGIIGGFIVFVLLFPMIPTAREAARRMQCANNMRQIMLAFHNYHDKYGHFPPAYTADENGKPLHSWRVLILPYIEQQGLYDQIRLDEPWDSEHNRQFHSEAPYIFQCRSGDPRESVLVPVPSGTTYSIVYGAETAFHGSQGTSITDRKVLSETIFLVERRIPVNWMDPSREIPFEIARRGINVDAMGISSYHPGIVNVAMGDGSVRAISESIDAETLRKWLMFDAKSPPLP